ncbi:MAG: hypothetical protein QME96_12905, partial [Myxococcota bacterium]|nr:hypothetical protein [Myxococcota bacterium]
MALDARRRRGQPPLVDSADVVRSFAVEERIPLAGTTPVGPVEPEGSRLLDWLRRGLAGDLTYLARTADLRGNPASPRLLRGGAMGAVVLGLPYERSRPAGADAAGPVAGYA